MKILDRYIVKTIAFYTLGVMFVWLSIYAFLNFTEEVEKIGQADYTILEAIFYVALDLPSVLYTHSSMIVLLGSLLALGHLASTSQLVILRGSGISIMKITSRVVKTALVFIMIIIIAGEFIAPLATQYAENSRAKALGHNIVVKNQKGFWIKDNNSIINVNKNFDGHLFGGVTLIKLNNSPKLNSVIHSDRAIFNGTNFALEKVKEYRLDHTNRFIEFQPYYYDKYNVKVSFDKELISSLKKKSYELSAWGLYKQINFLTNNNLAADVFEVELYKRVVKPLTLVAMIVFSMLFIFGSLRDATLGKKIFLGLALSLFFELFSRVGSALSLRLDYNHFVIAITPTLIVLVFSLILLRRKSAR